jgi:hypothetical protein
VTSSPHRKRRGAATQAIAAEWFRNHGFPYATDAGAGRIGRDLLNLIGLAGEIKARSDFNPLAWVRQALANADGDVPFVIVRCNGQGSATVADWPVIVRLEDFTRLVRLAGYGDPISDEETA